MKSWKQRRIFALIVFIAGIQGCAVTSPYSASSSYFIIPKDDTYATVFQSNRIFSSEGKPAEVVFRSLQEWQAFLKLYPTRNGDEASNKLSQVDYSKYMVLGVILGARGSGNHHVHIDSVIVEGGLMNVYSHEFYPGFGTRVFTNPAHFVVVEKRGLDVNF